MKFSSWKTSLAAASREGDWLMTRLSSSNGSLRDGRRLW
jgi:hypothetical protein